MTGDTVLLGYQARLGELHASTAHLRYTQIAALAILSLTVVVIFVLAFFALARHALPLGRPLLPLPIAIYSAHEYRRRHSTLLRTLRLERHYQYGIARLEDRWAGNGVSGEKFIPDGHLYATDLSVFGKGSLFELLCTCRTEVGRRSLAGYLLSPAPMEEITERQEAIQELQNRTDLRERMSLLGKFQFQESKWEPFEEWLGSPVVSAGTFVRLVAFASSACLLLLLLLGFDNVFLWSDLVSGIAPLLAINAVIGLIYRPRVLASLQSVKSMGLEIEVFRQGLQLLQSQRFKSAKLARLVSDLEVGNPVPALRKLTRLVNALSERDKEWFYGLSRALLVGTQLSISIERWKGRHARSLTSWLSAWGEFEALMALGTYSYEHPENSFPSLLDSGPAFVGRGLGHPLLPGERCVKNDVALDSGTRLYVISGSNMAGKSTLIRAVGLNAVLAYAGASVCAEQLSLSTLSICSSLSVADSLLAGKSKFLTEMDRLRRMIESCGGRRPVLFLIDEMLSGTNSRDRRTAAEAIIRVLVERRAMGILSTHDLSLTELPTLAGLPGTNVHMGARDSSDPLAFDYKLKPGVTSESNALAIARLAGVPV